MESIQLMNRKSERGFTLVELAIVMIIIGLLIGGILKGQELIANAQVGATVAQVKALDAATTTFRDKYNALPGDMNNVATRLANCAGCTDGDGDGRIENGVAVTAPWVAPANEGLDVFIELSAADLLGGISNSGAGGWGDQFPESKVGGGYHAAYSPGGAFGANAAASPGHYLGLVSTAGAVAANNALTSNQAARIDTKLDDGRANTGSVFSNAGAACSTAGDYNQQTTAKQCDLAIRFQN